MANEPMRPPTPEEAWSKISTPQVKANIVRGVVRLAMSLGLGPKDAGDIFSNLSDAEANNIGFMLSGVADGEMVKTVGKKLKGK